MVGKLCKLLTFSTFVVPGNGARYNDKSITNMNYSINYQVEIFSTARYCLAKRLHEAYNTALEFNGGYMSYRLIASYADMLTAYNELTDRYNFVNFSLFK